MIGWALLALLALAVAPFLVERLRRPLSPEERETAPGRFAKLSDGLTHYQWHGPEGGKVLVCIHGLTTPSYVWSELLEGLTGMGYRVLTYDHYGRGFSDRPSVPQTRDFFVRQLRELLQDQGVEGPVTLLGYSMGGSVATVFATAEPGRVGRVLLLAPGGMVHSAGWLAGMARSVPGLGDWLHLAFGGAQLVHYTRLQEGPLRLVADMIERQKLELSRRGYLPAVLSSLRNLLAESLEADHRALAERGLPVAAIWGGADSVIPIAAKDRLESWNPAAVQVVIAGAGHGLAFTHPGQVLDALKQVTG